MGKKEYLIIGNTKEKYRIDVADICYIQARGNRSRFCLTDGTFIELVMQLGQIKQVLPTSIPQSVKDFFPVGRSFVINKKNLSYICVTDKERKLKFFGKRTEDYLRGYKDGYSAGNLHGFMNESKLMPPDPVVLRSSPDTQLPKEDLQELMNNLPNTLLTKEK
jgi:hypothetical protein